MKPIINQSDEMQNKSSVQRLAGVFWTSALFISFLTFFSPILTESMERYSMVGETAVKGYEMVAYTPILSVFVITAPILNTVLHNAELLAKKKILLYFAVATAYVIAFGMCLILTAVRILNTENHIVMFSGGAYMVFILNLLHLSLGAIPTIWMMAGEDNEL